MNPEAQLLADALRDAREAASQARDVLSPVSNSASHITISAGGVGLWVAVTCTIVVMAVTVVGSIFVAMAVSDLNRQTQELRLTDETHQAYINSLVQEPQK